ncbi:MAG: hypothetical protein IPJ78_08420 [Gemmatimonadetes bacterium]|nr:hypothetical protein [Gemmatimonadota bacterium]
MRPKISYVQGHGLHVGRLLWWLPLMLGSLVGWPILAGADLFVRMWSGHQNVPFGLVVPLYLGYRAIRRYRALRAGGTMVLDRVFRAPGSEIELARAEQEPDRFAQLLRLEAWLMGSVVAAWSAAPIGVIIAAWFAAG